MPRVQGAPQQPPPPPRPPPHPQPSSSSPPEPQSSVPPQDISYDKRFTWNAIWSFFMRAPRIRSWLFQNKSPPQQQVVQSLLSGPVLTGYVFGSYSERVRSYSFPDIGDLHTVFCSDGEALLGFHFGFQGVHPVMPMLFEVAKDPFIGNPNVIVRRTARQKAPFPGVNCFLAIEFTWYQSGSLSVSTSVNPVDPDDKPPTGLTAFLDNAEIRVFNPTTAERLLRISALYGESLDFGHFPQPSSFNKLPDEFLNPPDDYYNITIREPRDSVYHSSLIPADIGGEQTFHARNEFPAVKTSQTPFGGAIMHCDRGDVSSVASPRTIALWKGYQQAVAHSRRAGLFATMFEKKVGGRFGKVYSLFGRDVRYTFLSTAGINVHGRIQRLCNQLGIVYTSPLPDPALMSPTTLDGGSCFNSPAGYLTSCGTDADSELDTTISAFGRMESSKRKVDCLLRPEVPQGFVATGQVESDGVGQARSVVPYRKSDPPMSFQSTDGSAQRSISQSTSTDLRHSYSGCESLGETRSRHPKRPRYSPASGMRPMTPGSNATEESLRYSPTDNAREGGKIALHENTKDSEQRNQLRERFHISTGAMSVDQTAKLVRNSVRRRPFDITHMLSDDSKFYASQNSSTGSEAVSSTLNRSTEGTHVTAGATAQKPEQSLPQTSRQPAAEEIGNTVKPEMKTTASTKKGAGTVWTCDRCGVQIRGKKGNLNRHIANKHDNIRAYACKVPNCGRKFQTRLNLVRHETAVHLGRPFTCPNCPRAFKYENDLQGHIKSAHENADATLACDVCGSCFGRRSTLNRHKAKVHKLSEEQPPVTGNAVAET